jgi:hypothetical protein
MPLSLLLAVPLTRLALARKGKETQTGTKKYVTRARRFFQSAVNTYQPTLPIK